MSKEVRCKACDGGLMEKCITCGSYRCENCGAHDDDRIHDLEVQVEKLQKELDIATSFYLVTLKERDYERTRYNNLLADYQEMNQQRQRLIIDKMVLDSNLLTDYRTEIESLKKVNDQYVSDWMAAKYEFGVNMGKAKEAHQAELAAAQETIKRLRVELEDMCKSCDIELTLAAAHAEIELLKEVVKQAQILLKHPKNVDQFLALESAIVKWREVKDAS